MRWLELEARMYRQFDADHDRDAPATGFGGWFRHPVRLPLERTALVVMHAWDCGTREEYPGWWRCEDYIPRADRIVAELFPRLLGTAREAGMPMVHVTCGSSYCSEYPGYKRALELAGPPPEAVPGAPKDEAMEELNELRRRIAFPGEQNLDDVARGWAKVDFAAEAKPVGDELIAKDAHQLNACCRHLGVSHLVYVGFAINWCLLMSPGGMVDMHRLGYVCSAIAQATTAVERRESAVSQEHKEAALWKVSVGFGLVFDAEDWLGAFGGE